MLMPKILVTAILTGCCWGASAESGTPEEQAACRPDVRRLCSDVPQGAADSAYQACLEMHRDALSQKCLAVLVDHGR